MPDPTRKRGRPMGPRKHPATMRLDEELYRRVHAVSTCTGKTITSMVEDGLRHVVEEMLAADHDLADAVERLVRVWQSRAKKSLDA